LAQRIADFMKDTGADVKIDQDFLEYFAGGRDNPRYDVAVEVYQAYPKFLNEHKDENEADRAVKKFFLRTNEGDFGRITNFLDVFEENIDEAVEAYIFDPTSLDNIWEERAEAVAKGAKADAEKAAKAKAGGAKAKTDAAKAREDADAKKAAKAKADAEEAKRARIDRISTQHHHPGKSSSGSSARDAA
jgi:hypothetical protein